MKISAKDYNLKFLESVNYGYVVRYNFGDWVVCDGLAPNDDDLWVDEESHFIGYVVKRFKTFEEADRLRNILNEN